MAIQIPSSLPISNTVDFQRNDLISPPTAPAVIESLAAIDPRVALKMPIPVNDSSAGKALHDGLQEAAAKFGSANLQNVEPHADKAVLLELSNALGKNRLLNTPDSQKDLANLLSQNLSRLDRSGSAALGQLLSSILTVDVPEFSEQIQAPKDSKTAASGVVVNWPNRAGIAENVTSDPRVAMGSLYQSLKNSGVFAADQLKKLLSPAGIDDLDELEKIGDLREGLTKLISQLSIDNPAIKDSVKLLLRGDLLWQGELTPNVHGRMYREDAWEADSKEPNHLQKGSQITMEVELPHLGVIKVVGAQFGEAIHISVEAKQRDTEDVFTSDFNVLLDRVRSQVDLDAQVSLKSEPKE